MSISDNQQKRVSINFFSIFLGRGAGLFLNLFAVVLSARFLGVEKYGLFAALLSTITILTKFIDFGFSPIITRESAKNQNDFTILNNAISFRILFFLVLVIFSNIVFKFTNIAPVEILYSNILFLNIIFSSRFLSFRELLEIPFKINLKMHIVMLVNFLDNTLLLILILFMPFFTDILLYYIIVFCISNVPGFIIVSFLLYKKLNYKFKFRLESTKWLIKQSLPLMGYAIFLSLFQQLDVVLTKNFISEAANGIYSAALRLTIPLSVFPIAIVSTTLPLIISNLEKKNIHTKRIIALVYKLLLLISFISAILISFKAEEVVLFLLGQEYLDSSLVVVILVWSNIFLFFSFFTVEILTVFNMQKFNFYYSLIIVFFDLLLFGILFENYTFVGVAIARASATIIGAIFLKYILRRLDKNIKVINLKFMLFGIILISAGALFSQLNLIVFIFLTILLFPILIVKMDLFEEYEMELLLNIFKIKNISPKLYSFLKH